MCLQSGYLPPPCLRLRACSKPNRSTAQTWLPCGSHAGWMHLEVDAPGIPDDASTYPDYTNIPILTAIPTAAFSFSFANQSAAGHMLKSTHEPPLPCP
ncbi:MAG: hypothetical protein HPY85_15770 [Anaerolineae bacterium]|nr:hypothetical protein [Anaerolineae bacterium]